ncbi:hypothetical protein VP01_1449g2 [Puccinia sorghi]|uniref:Uncharacterized protein n=1 Tax=Puccinia sorghi TaxID=27349 RepID=A0A0L6VKN0_9BASI|nr:hypothetical protein VP01_1449g2 [Puccinia sorghi]
MQGWCNGEQKSMAAGVQGSGKQGRYQELTHTSIITNSESLSGLQSTKGGERECLLLEFRSILTVLSNLSSGKPKSQLEKSFQFTRCMVLCSTLGFIQDDSLLLGDRYERKAFSAYLSHMHDMELPVQVVTVEIWFKDDKLVAVQNAWEEEISACLLPCILYLPPSLALSLHILPIVQRPYKQKYQILTNTKNLILQEHRLGISEIGIVTRAVSMALTCRCFLLTWSYTELIPVVYLISSAIQLEISCNLVSSWLDVMLKAYQPSTKIKKTLGYDAITALRNSQKRQRQKTGHGWQILRQALGRVAVGLAHLSSIKKRVLACRGYLDGLPSSSVFYFFQLSYFSDIMNCIVRLVESQAAELNQVIKTYTKPADAEWCLRLMEAHYQGFYPNSQCDNHIKKEYQGHKMMKVERLVSKIQEGIFGLGTERVRSSQDAAQDRDGKRVWKNQLLDFLENEMNKTLTKEGSLRKRRRRNKIERGMRAPLYLARQCVHIAFTLVFLEVSSVYLDPPKFDTFTKLSSYNLSGFFVILSQNVRLHSFFFEEPHPMIPSVSFKGKVKKFNLLNAAYIPSKIISGEILKTKKQLNFFFDLCVILALLLICHTIYCFCHRSPLVCCLFMWVLVVGNVGEVNSVIFWWINQDYLRVSDAHGHGTGGKGLCLKFPQEKTRINMNERQFILYICICMLI